MEKEREQVPGRRDKEITVQFDEQALDEYVRVDKAREPDEGLTPRGDMGLSEAALDGQGEDEGDETRQTSDMNSPGDPESEDEGLPGGTYAQDERGEGVERLPSWDTRRNGDETGR